MNPVGEPPIRWLLALPHTLVYCRLIVFTISTYTLIIARILLENNRTAYRSSETNGYHS